MNLRIISGSLKGKKIASLPGLSTRPTSDKVREAIFSIIGHEIKGASFLELFAGTGAIAIEALSRGADSAVLIENGLSAAETIRKNLEHCGIADKAKLIRWDIEKNLNCIKDMDNKFDMVFLDPPYEKNLVKTTLKHLGICGSIASEACVIVQHSKDEPIDLKGIEEFYSMEKDRRYGKNIVSILRYMV
ncbi:16S rRNA (guanine(966)-N(2))-methyltransferase RsmD [Desulforegula conservatrix]|uniref:16S rRNA (guanine(966)-N(2))-methyltransferase RsmD n=1 Tax=Desulforegula conservatrix TaxID=153026 RepID=UPI000422299A|nr:16S rRNA (guanine(966)-N(2))-methyltransferase RsmD [Desulforegula conservatrix]